MRVLIAHNFYQHPGGEDLVFATESRLLEEHGHAVARLTVRNDDVELMGKLALAKATFWNRTSYDRVRALVREHRPDVVHFHNTFPLLSPAVYSAARAEGAAVVQSLHNFRLLCAGATLYRDGQPCERCVGSATNWHAVAHACYRGSRAATAVTAAMLAGHRAVGTWNRTVDLYLSLSEFARGKFIAGGLDADRVVAKPNCVDPDPGVGAGRGGYALFAARLTPEKGVTTLLDAWSRLAQRQDIRLKVIGDGPLAPRVVEAAQANDAIEYLGRRPVEEVHRLMGEARLVVVPSTWYEGMPLTIIEAYATGTPVLASRLGAMAEFVEHGRTGWTFSAGDAGDLAQQVERVWGLPDDRLRAYRQAARQRYEERFTARMIYQKLVDAYRMALARRHASAPEGRSDAVGGVTVPLAGRGGVSS